MLNRLMIAIGLVAFVSGSLNADIMQNAPGGQAAPMVDCSKMPPDISQFAMQLSSTNQKMFCGQFNDSQRSTAMQLASQQDAMGKSMMSPDMAVQKVAADNNIMMTPTQKTPTGCPVK